MSPKNASINGDGFRFYRFEPSQVPAQQRIMAAIGLTEEQRTEPTDVLSVTSIKSLTGEPFQLVRWKISNVVNLAMGVRKQTRIGPRGGVKEVYVKDGPFPGEFVTRMMATRGDEQKLDEARRWVNAASDEPRDIAAVRGSVVHKLIEKNYPLRKLDDDAIRERFEEQWRQERRKVKPDVTDEDIAFALNAMRQYWDMRANVPFVIIAQEPQVFNLAAGYAGSADVLMWFLAKIIDGKVVPLPGVTPEAIQQLQALAESGRLNLAMIEQIGGFLAIGDWKTSKSVYTAHVVQTTAYLGAQFIAEDGIIDERLTAMLNAALKGLVIHIRPNLWEVSWFDFRQDVYTWFLGSVAYARGLAGYPKPNELFTATMSGQAPGTDESVEMEDAA